MQGIITVQARNAVTFELENEFEIKNTISDNFLRILHYNNTLNNVKIGISDAVFKSSIYPSRFYIGTANGLTAIQASTDIAGVPAVSFIDKTVNSSAIIQFATRFSPPATGTRSIKSIVLNTPHPGLINTNVPVVLAFSELTTPCVQTSSQVYDIYYRVILDYAETTDSLSESMYLALMKKMTLNSCNFANYGSSYISPFPILKKTVGDNIYVPWLGSENTQYTSNYDYNPSMSYPKGSLYSLKTYGSTDVLSFDRNLGTILNTEYQYINGSNSTPFKLFGGVTISQLFSGKSKIQNLFGFKADSVNKASPQFLDIDNLATGSGTIALTGDWIDEQAPTVPDMYFKTLFPRKGIITVTDTGGVGVSKYKYSEQINLGFSKVGAGTDTHISSLKEINPLYAATGTDRPYSNDISIIGDISENYFSTEQISGTTDYDGTSVLILKKNQVILYSIPGSRYWKITGAFTNVHQVAVRNGVVFIACRDTGLYSVDPRVSLSAVKITVTGYRTANFSGCNGVAVGYGDKIWAVGLDALASFDGTAWTLYDSTTTPQFGTDSSHYAKIGYIKIDKNSPDSQMMFVYKATLVSTKLGLWWSLVSSLIETGAQPTLYSFGSPKLNKTHVGGRAGYWHVVSNNTMYVSAFNGSSFSLTTVAASVTSTFTSLLYVTNAGVDKILKITSNYQDTTGNPNNRLWSQNIVALNGTSEYLQPTSEASLYFGYINSSWTAKDPLTTPVNSAGYTGYMDAVCSIMLENGLCFNIKKSTDVLSSGGTMVTSGIFQACLDNTPHGGAYRDVARNNYGWDGASWVKDNVSSKLTHSTTDILMNGVYIAFTEGSSGMSFNANNIYKFGLNRGLLKDNATRASMSVPIFLSKTTKAAPELTSTTVPVVSSLPIGLVGIHSVFKSKDVYIDASNRVTFPGNTGGQFAVGDKSLNGDFKISIPCTDVNVVSNQHTTLVGVGKPHLGGLPMIGLGFDSGATVYIYVANTPYDTESYGIATSFTVTTTDVVSIKRTAGIFTVEKNGVTQYTFTTNSVINGLNQRLEVIHATVGNSKFYTAGLMFCPPVTIVTNGSDNAVTFGNAVTGTESFDLTCKGVCVDSPVSGTLNGVTAPVITSGALPVPGQIALDLDTMVMTFNSADAGKSIGIDCTRYWSR